MCVCVCVCVCLSVCLSVCQCKALCEKSSKSSHLSTSQSTTTERKTGRFRTKPSKQARAHAHSRRLRNTRCGQLKPVTFISMLKSLRMRRLPAVTTRSMPATCWSDGELVRGNRRLEFGVKRSVVSDMKSMYGAVYVTATL